MTPAQALAVQQLRPGPAGARWQLTGSALLRGLDLAQVVRLQDILAALAGWAEAGEPPMRALLPLGAGPAPAVLLNVARQGGHGVIITAAAMHDLAGHAERLLPLLPAPETGSSPAAVPLSPPFPPLPVQSGWSDIGIAWRDMALIVPQASEVLPALVTVLAQMQPREQAQRITGWATTAMLPAAGGFDPYAACPLLVLGPGRRRPRGLPHQIVKLQPSGAPPVSATAPPAFAAWRALRIATGNAVADWAVAMAGDSAPDLMRRLTAALPGTRNSLLAALLLHDARHAAVLLAAWLADDGAAGVDGSLIDQVPTIAFLDGLDHLPQPAPALRALPLARLAALVTALPGHPAGTGPLASDLAARLAELQPDHPALPSIVARRLNAMAGHDLERLATAQVVRALARTHPALALKLTSGAIARPAGSIQTLAASLAAVQLAARAR